MILNSDVVVFDGWLSSLVKSLNSHKKIGAVGTLSNSIWKTADKNNIQK